MSVNETAAYAMYPRNVALPEVVSALNQAGFENEDICMVLSPAHPVATDVGNATIGDIAGEDSARSARMIGWVSKFGAVVIPTVGFFIRSQAFFHALMVARDAPALCGNARTLVGLGFTEREAQKYEEQLDQLGVLVYISCANGAKMDWAREVLRHTGAKEAATLEQRMSVAASA